MITQAGTSIAFICPHAAALMGRFMEAQTSFAELPEEQQPDHMGVESSDCVHWMVDYICRHREPVKLLLCRSEGTSYEHFVHNMVEVEVEYTLKYMDVLRRLGREIPELDEQMCHIIASGMFNGIFEIVIHDMPEGKALRYVDQLRDFYTAGRLKLMGPKIPQNTIENKKEIPPGSGVCTSQTNRRPGGKGAPFFFTG